MSINAMQKLVTGIITGIEKGENDTMIIMVLKDGKRHSIILSGSCIVLEHAEGF